MPTLFLFPMLSRTDIENDGNNTTATTNAWVSNEAPAKRSSEPGAFSDWETSANPMIGSIRVEGTAVYNTSRDRLGTIQHIMIDKLSEQSEFAGFPIIRCQDFLKQILHCTVFELEHLIPVTVQAAAGRLYHNSSAQRRRQTYQDVGANSP